MTFRIIPNTPENNQGEYPRLGTHWMPDNSSSRQDALLMPHGVYLCFEVYAGGSLAIHERRSLDGEKLGWPTISQAESDHRYLGGWLEDKHPNLFKPDPIANPLNEFGEE